MAGAGELFAVSSVLGESAVYSSIPEAVQICIERAVKARVL